ncbi:MAG: cupin domain-containing protein [Candidatus Brocadiae bacterium]|nr:cupin domain-containing protein [Candidatus Brocadiia bacterium]
MECINRNDSAAFTTKDGSTVRSLIDRANSSAVNQSLAEATVPPGGATEPHRHTTSEEIYYILSGTGRITVGDESRDVQPLDAILIPPNTRHTIANTGEADLVFLCCCSLPYSHGDTVLE